MLIRPASFLLFTSSIVALLLVGCASSSQNSLQEGWLVEATGTGETLGDATNDAIFEALIQATGALVAAEAELSGDELREQITVYAEGLVERYELLDTRQDASGWTAVVLAEVRQSELQQSLEEIIGSEVEVRGQDLAARVEVLRRQRESSRLLLLKALNELRGMYDYEILGELEFVHEENGQTTLSIPIRVGISMSRYREWMARFFPWLDKMAVASTNCRWTHEESYSSFPLQRSALDSLAEQYPPFGDSRRRSGDLLLLIDTGQKLQTRYYLFPFSGKEIRSGDIDPKVYSCVPKLVFWGEQDQVLFDVKLLPVGFGNYKLIRERSIPPYPNILDHRDERWRRNKVNWNGVAGDLNAAPLEFVGNLFHIAPGIQIGGHADGVQEFEAWMEIDLPNGELGAIKRVTLSTSLDG